MSDQKSAAEIATEIKTVETKIEEVKNTPATTIKDEKWTQTRISELEDELFMLRKTLKSAPAPSAEVKPAMSTKKTGMMDNFFGWDSEDKA